MCKHTQAPAFQSGKVDVKDLEDSKQENMLLESSRRTAFPYTLSGHVLVERVYIHKKPTNTSCLSDTLPVVGDTKIDGGEGGDPT